MDGNLSEQCIVTSQCSLLKFGHRQSLAQTRSRLSSWQACLGEREAREVTGMLLAAAQVSCGAGIMSVGWPWGGQRCLGSCECVLFEGLGHSLEPPISLGQQVTSATMATETDWTCPICRAGAGEKASVSPCNHQFCLGCIVRWLKRNPSCPLCRQPINRIIYSWKGKWRRRRRRRRRRKNL
uniref:RING-type domain-containing protein n=1 Tax=Catharus ustulatus TaxID=91951 RepID=A0A8C3UL48_CATUS